MDDAAAVSEVLDERPELEPPLQEVLDVDETKEGWTFDDVPVDSGQFGELVSRGLVERTEDGDGYRIANPEAVRTALADEASEHGTDDGKSRPSDFAYPNIDAVIRDRLRGIDSTTVGALTGALLAIVVARAHVFASVFRDGVVVLSANDPYYYRYWVEEALRESGGTLDITGLSIVPEGVTNGEPLLVATLWAVSAVFGGQDPTAGWVLAWYPVVSAVVTGGLLYVLTLRVTTDSRVALAAVLLLAITPAHVLRTSLGFADHHAFDYLWLILTAYALVRVSEHRWVSSQSDAGEDRDGTVLGPPRNWLAGGLLGVALAGQVLAWDASALLIAPVGLALTVFVLDDVRADRSPLEANVTLVGGVALAAVVVYTLHASAGWHTDTVAFSPLFLLGGVLGVVLAGEIVKRLDLSTAVLGGAIGVGTVAGPLVIRSVFPSYWTEAIGGLNRLTAQRNIAETESLLSGDTLGWLLLFGFILVLAFPYLAWAGREVYAGESVWTVPAVYCLYFLGLGVFQVRFAGQLAMFASLFAGFGFVHLAAVVDLTEPPAQLRGTNTSHLSLTVPDREQVVRLSLLCLLVASVSIIQVPIKTGQVTTDPSAYRTAGWMAEYGEDANWKYPDNYVLSRWGDNRMYNYFVNGEAESYGFALRTYAAFLGGTNTTRWFHRLSDRVGFIVTEDGLSFPSGTMYSHLHRHNGGTSSRLTPSGRFRLLFAPENSSYKVFSPVKGALIVGKTTPNGTGTASATVPVSGSTFTYERESRATATGWYALRVPYPVSYRLSGNGTVTVTESDVSNGSIAGEKGPNATWLLDAGRGQVAFDSRGGNHALVEGGDWRPTADGYSLALDGGYVEVPAEGGINGTDGFMLSVRFKTRSDVDYVDDNAFPRIVARAKASGYRDTDGYQIAMSEGRLLGAVGNGTTATRVWGGDVTDGEWHQVTLTWNGSRVRLYVDGELADTGRFEGSPASDVPLTFGASADKEQRFVGSIDRVYYRSGVVDRGTIRAWNRHNSSEP